MASLTRFDAGTCCASFFIESADELDILPTSGRGAKDKSLKGVGSVSPGSVARCPDGTAYVLTGTGGWQKMPDSVAALGGGLTELAESLRIRGISPEEIDAIFA